LRAAALACCAAAGLAGCAASTPSTQSTALPDRTVSAPASTAAASDPQVPLSTGDRKRLTAIPSSTVMPCVENGQGPDGPIAADTQALSPARLRGGAAPLRMHSGMTVITEAEIRRHWQAAETTRARTDRADKTETRTTTGRNQ
jgi:hypothetical protein